MSENKKSFQSLKKKLYLTLFYSDWLDSQTDISDINLNIN